VDLKAILGNVDANSDIFPHGRRPSWWRSSDHLSALRCPLGGAVHIIKCGRLFRVGQRDIRRLLIIGAMTVVRWAVRKGAAKGSWLARMLAAKPRLVAAIALANKMTRSVWAMLSKGEDYRGSALAPA
jgi:hypothetical protein